MPANWLATQAVDRNGRANERVLLQPPTLLRGQSAESLATDVSAIRRGANAEDKHGQADEHKHQLNVLAVDLMGGSDE